jgi:hypothetical protein
MRSIVRLIALACVLLSTGCAKDKPPVTDSGPAKADEAGEAGGEAGGGEAGGGEVGEADGASGNACQIDADCVPAECCHPASCVLASAAPECSDVMCTEHCAAGTLDCGQGHCACQAGSCVAVIDNAVE